MVAEVLARRSWRRRVWELQLLGSQGRRGGPGLPDLWRMKPGTLTPGMGGGRGCGKGGGGQAPNPGFWKRRKLEAWNPGSWESGAGGPGLGAARPGPAAGTLVLPWRRELA